MRRARFPALARRVATLGAGKELAEQVVAEAIRRADGGSARLAAAVAMVHALVGRGRVRRGVEAVQVLEDLLSTPDTYIPAPFWREEHGGVALHLRTRSRALVTLLVGLAFAAGRGSSSATS